MSERVNQLIDELREKALRLKDSLSTERSKNNLLEEEIDRLRAVVSEKEDDLQQKIEEIEALRNDMVTMNTTSISVQNEGNISDEQIDELVKEIEYCIAKLKQ